MESHEGGITRKLKALLRTDFVAFLQKVFFEASGSDIFYANWHLEAIAWELSRIETGENTRLIVTMPPRHLKSLTTAQVA